MRKVLLLVLSLAVMMPAAASALTVVDGAAYASNSWSQAFGTSWGGVTFDHLRLDWISGSQFSGPYIVADSGWSLIAGSATLAASGGPGTTGLGWTATFTDPMANAMSFYGSWYNGNTHIATERFDWSGSGWSIYQVSGVNPGPVPEPGTFALLGLGLVGFGVMRRRKQA